MGRSTKDSLSSQEEVIISSIMYKHWDMKACECWLCKAARENGLRPMGHWKDEKTKKGEKYGNSNT